MDHLVIFGCNGVLVDAEMTVARVRAAALAEAGIALDAEVVAERFSGQTTKDMLITLEKESNVPMQATLIDRIERQVGKRLAREARAMEGARAVVEATAPRAVCACVPRAELDLLLSASGLKALFDGGRSFALEDVGDGRPFPAPDLFLHAAREHGADAEGCFVVDHSPAAIAAAAAAGMRAIGFSGGTHSYPGHADRLTDAGAETVISRWRDFPEVLAALKLWRDA